eukprot:4943558-Prymnesium_polylepis.3
MSSSYLDEIRKVEKQAARFGAKSTLCSITHGATLTREGLTPRGNWLNCPGAAGHGSGCSHVHTTQRGPHAHDNCPGG